MGAVGVLIMVRPGVTGWSLGAGLAILAAAISAVAQLIVKKLTRTETPGAIASYMVLLLVPMSLCFSLSFFFAPAIA